MKKEYKIPTIGPDSGDELHFGKRDFRISLSELQHLFHINRLEDFRSKLSFPLPPHRKTVHDLIFLTHGESTRTKGLNEYSFGKNQLFFLPKLQITKHKSMSKDVKGFFIHFSSDLISEYNHSLKEFPFLNILDYPVISIPDKEVPFITNIFVRLEHLYSQMTKDNLALISLYILTLLKEVNTHVVKKEFNLKINTSGALTEKYKNALTQNIYDIQTVREYAEILYVTPNHLNKCVKSTLNKTAQALLNEMLILEGKSLLKYSGLSISGIAEKLGNRSPTNFSRFFKNQTGMTPKEYMNT